MDSMFYQNISLESPKPFPYLNNVHAEVSNRTLPIALQYLEESRNGIAFEVSKIDDVQDVIALLDAGADHVRVTDVQAKQISAVDNIDQKRVVLAQESSKNVVPAEKLTPQTSAQHLLAGAVSDRPDGLFSTLVVDERGIALGLVYSNLESLTESFKTGRGVYHSRRRGLWYKGDTSGDVQELISVSLDCDSDCLFFKVRQKGRGFCHLERSTCFGEYRGLSRLEKTLKSRKESAPPGSYTARLFNDRDLLNAKIKEEATELCEATKKDHIAFEAADLMYFAMTKCIAEGVDLADVERVLDNKDKKVKRRRGDAKPAFLQTNDGKSNGRASLNGNREKSETIKEAASVPKDQDDAAGVDRKGMIKMTRYTKSRDSTATITEALKRPSQRSTDMIMGIVKPIIDEVRAGGDKALLKYTHKFEKATSLTSPVLRAPFPVHLMQLPEDTIAAIDTSFANIRTFHAAQRESKPLEVETMPGVRCSRFSRPIERVGLYVPGGTAVLPSTALMLGVPAMVAGCKKIVLASPPRSDGSITPEIVYIAHKIGAESIVLAGGAQAVAALAYGTESTSKVDKILGPGNQFVTAGKMLVSNDTTAGVSIDMPAGPSEVLVVADKTSVPAFVASDLLSQAEHGVDSQVVCIAIGMNDEQVTAIESELHRQATALPRMDIVRGAIEHSVTICVDTVEEAMDMSNQYAPEHLILQCDNAEGASKLVENAGSVFIGPWTPESVGDYSAGVNHSLPTYGYARQYSGVNLSSYVKHITASRLTKEGLRNVSGAVMKLAEVEELEAHRRAVEIRLAHMDA
ncbi:MAG: trifunctional histidinol dehydrogenase [Chrysothrix sp. TS-e1954]|nr:MAG: trifunctional histidinol dehydrogenase [Chrysothrix sp. TS-e1954]